MNKDILIKVSNGDINSFKIFKKKSIITKKSHDKLFIDTERINVNLKNRNVYILIEDEEVYIKYLKLPNTKKKQNLNNIIKNELVLLYGNKSEKIFYTYTILDKKDKELDVLVFCIYSEKLKCLEQYLNNNNIKKINLIQLCFLNYFEGIINEKDYILLFVFNNTMYLLGSVNGKMAGNKIICKENCSYKMLIDGLRYISDKLESYNAYPNNIYGVNINDESLMKYLKGIEKYNFVDMGNVEEKDILEYFTIKKE